MLWAPPRIKYVDFYPDDTKNFHFKREFHEVNVGIASACTHYLPDKIHEKIKNTV